MACREMGLGQPAIGFGEVAFWVGESPPVAAESMTGIVLMKGKEDEKVSR